MSYSWLTFAQLKTALSQRLSDVGKVFWLDDELGRIAKESLRTWNSVAQFYRDRTTFNTQANIAFYDISQVSNPNSITGGSNAATAALLGYTLKDRDLIVDIEYHLIEPITTTWSPLAPALTEQFTITDITKAIERRRNLFLLLTGLNLSHSQVVFGAPPGNGRLPLSSTISLVRRAAWLDSNGAYTPLWCSDEEEANFLRVGWSLNASVPEAYSMLLPPPVTLQLIPIPTDVGTVDLITVTNPADLDETVGVLLNVPDDFGWVIKWGALADLLSRDGEAFDPKRAAYCDNRFLEGVRYAQLGGTIDNIHINSIPIAPNDIDELDAFNPSWQNAATTPTDAAILGRNLIALSPTPDDIYSVLVDVVRNMPMPTSDSSFVQVGKEHIDAILDYCVHLAMFKVGGAEFDATIPLANNFMQQAMLHNQQLKAEAKGYDIMQNYSKKQEVDKPSYIREAAA